jgi:hypothetical protein
MSKLVDLMELKSIDRIDLQVNGGNSGDFIEINPSLGVNEWPNITHNHIDDDKMYVGRHDVPNTYVYNVNPSIWRRDALIDIYSKFSNRTYRDIEYDDTQSYVTEKYLIYNLYSVNHKQHCGYLTPLPFYKYLHITHYRRLLRFNETFTTEFNQSYIDTKEEYINIVNKYNLKHGSRIFS